MHNTTMKIKNINKSTTKKTKTVTSTT